MPPYQSTVAGKGISKSKLKKLDRKRRKAEKRRGRPHKGSPAPTAPRTEEPTRRDLEALFMRQQRNLWTKRCYIAYRNVLTKLHHRYDSEAQRRKEDMLRRKVMSEIIESRVEAGADEPGEETKWKALAEVGVAEWREKEGEHRHWMIAELWKLTNYKYKGEIASHRNHCAAEQQLLEDTLQLPNLGGLPAASVAWLRRSLSSETIPHRRNAPRGMEALARQQAANYIAACRREAGIRLELEEMGSNRGHPFPNINVAWSRFELEEHEWANSYDVDSQDEEESEDDKLRFAQKLAGNLDVDYGDEVPMSESEDSDESMSDEEPDSAQHEHTLLNRDPTPPQPTRESVFLLPAHTQQAEFSFATPLGGGVSIHPVKAMEGDMNAEPMSDVEYTQPEPISAGEWSE